MTRLGRRHVPKIRALVVTKSPCPGSRPPRLAILVVDCADRLARLLPLLVAPFAQIVEAAGRNEMLRTVDRDGLATEPFAAGREQERREVLQLRHVPDAA